MAPMPSIQTPAIILTVKDIGEAVRLVTFLTPAKGRLTGLAKHAKKSRKRFANVLEPLNRAMAGGITERGARNRIRIIRIVNGQQKKIDVQMTDLIRPNDTIEVPQRYF